MVRTPKLPHSKPRSAPPTIDLGAEEVSRVPNSLDEAPASGTTLGPDPDAEAIVEPTRETEADPVEDIVGADPTPDASPAPGFVAPEPGSVVEDRPDGDDYRAATPDKNSSFPIDPSPQTFDERNRTEPERPYGSGASMAAPVPPAKTQSSRRGLSMLTAGVIGGVVALAGGGVLQYAGMLPTPGGFTPPTTDLESELATLREQVAALQAASPGDGAATARIEAFAASLEDVRAEVATLRSDVQSGAVGAGGADAAPLTAFEARLKTLEDNIARLGTEAGGIGGADPAALAAQETRFKTLEDNVARLGSEVGEAAAAELAALGERIAGVEALVRSGSEAATAGEGRLATLEQTLEALGETVGSLGRRVDAQAAQPKVAMAIAASGLKAALDRGGAFASELETFAAVAPDAPEIAPLRALAQTGVPTREELAAEARAATDAMIAQGQAAPADAGFFDRLLTSAESLVTVRPVGPVEGAGAPAVAARMEAAIGQGDLAQALAEYDAMPEPAKGAGAAFAQKLRDRLEAERLTELLIANAMKAA